jgi:hypothetical protein
MVCIIIPWSGDRSRQLKTLIRELTEHQPLETRLVLVRCDHTPFNRGLIKNAGFLEAACAETETVCFHDVDILPQARIFYPECTDATTVYHLYGHPHCLGGVVLMQSGLFRRANGFPVEQWAWGGEDRQLQVAVEACGGVVDRTYFSNRFTGRRFAEMNSHGRPMPHQAARRAFSGKQPYFSQRLYPSALDQTHYMVEHRETVRRGRITYVRITY